MSMPSPAFILSLLGITLSYIPLSEAVDVSGSAGIELRYFTQDKRYANQHDSYLAGYFSPEWYWANSDDSNSFTFTPFFSFDIYDDERSHADVREFHWLHVADSWELLLGSSRTFWGTTEAVHLVDVINQTDLVESIDGDEKLGQPQIRLTVQSRVGAFELYTLPIFRERTFPGEEGRLRFALPVAGDKALYESDDKKNHVDYAVRWFHSFGSVDFGLSYFRGTNRDPSFVLGSEGQELILQPFYSQIKQTGAELVWSDDNILWKFEAIERKGLEESYIAAVAGFEVTWLTEQGYDIAMLMEYLYDDRGSGPTTLAPTLFDNDTFIGMRLNLNDIDATRLLLGVIIDNDDAGQVYSLEASHRVNSRVSLEIEAFVYRNTGQESVLYPLRHDDYLECKLIWYF